MKTVEVVAAIIVKDGKVFATQRGYGETLESVKWLPADLAILDKIVL